VARGQRLVDRASAELDQDRQQYAEVQQLQRQLLAVDRRRLFGVLGGALAMILAFGGRGRPLAVLLVCARDARDQVEVEDDEQGRCKQRP
jgi:hypothetical protein